MRTWAWMRPNAARTLAACLTGVAAVSCLRTENPAKCMPAGETLSGQWVIYVEGSGGSEQPQFFAGVQTALRQSGVTAEVFDFRWNTGDGLLADHFADLDYKRARANELAALIQQLAADHPSEPIDLLAFSAGSVVTVFALEQLPAALVRNVVFVESSLSRAHELTPALANVSGRVVNFSSPIDSLLLAT